MTKDVFAVVPSYEHAAFVGTCLRSIFEQTLRPKKLLVIDDGSTDGSTEIIGRLLEECPFDAELISRKNRGLCATLNQAYSLSSGEYFAYLGSDDAWMPQFLEKRVELLEKHPEAIAAYGHANIIDAKDHVICTTENVGADNIGVVDLRGLLLNAIAPVSSTVLYRRSALRGLSWNEESRLEDYEMYLKLLPVGEFVFDPTVLASWRDHGNNTGKNDLMMMREVLGAQDRQRENLGLTSAEFAALQRRTRFRFARTMLQHGDKAGAAATAKDSWREAESTAQLLRFVARLILPFSFVQMIRRLRGLGPSRQARPGEQN